MSASAQAQTVGGQLGGDVGGQESARGGGHGEGRGPGPAAAARVGRVGAGGRVPPRQLHVPHVPRGHGLAHAEDQHHRPQLLRSSR